MNDKQRVAAVRAHMDYHNWEAYVGGWTKPTRLDVQENPNALREWRAKVDRALVEGTMPRDGYGTPLDEQAVQDRG